MKKLLLIPLFFTLILTGCEKNTVQTATADVFTVTDGVTHDGVGIGDDQSAFSKAYADYVIQVAYNDTDYSTYTVMSMRKIPFDRDISTLITGFFIDGEPASEEELCEENEVKEEDLADLLMSSAYLQAHEVIYRYLRFTWEGGVIANIDSAELNFNEAYDVPKLDL